MKKSPHRFFLFMCSYCSCSFSPRRRLHVLKAGSKWIELVCGGVPVRLAPQNPHLQTFSRCSRDARADNQQAAAQLHDYITDNSTAQSPVASQRTFNAHHFCTSLPQQRKALFLGRYIYPWPVQPPLFTPSIFLSRLPLFAALYPIHYCMFILQKCNLAFKGKTAKWA